MPVDDPGNLYAIHPAADPDEPQNEQAEPAPQLPPGVEAIDGVCGFLMVQGHDGRWRAYFEMEKVGPMSVQRQAHRYDALAAFSQIEADICAGINAETAIQAQMQVAQQVAQQQEAMRLAERLNLGPNGRPRG